MLEGLRRLPALLLLALLAWLSLGAQAQVGPQPQPQTQPLLLSDSQPRVEIWPAVRVLSDPSGQMDLAAARAAAADFRLPSTARNTLGHRRDAVWLRVPLKATPQTDGRWLLDIEYAVLNRVDVYLLGPSGFVLQQTRLGNFQSRSQRPLPTRSHAVDLQLLPGQAHELYLRVETLGGMILPMSLNKESAFIEHALGEQMLQGLLTGLGLCLVFYSLAQWLTLRETLLLKYALLIGSGVLFSIVQFGIGKQYLWGDWLWPEQHLAAIAALLAAAGTFLFVEDVLRGPERWRWFSPLMKSGAAFLALVALAYGVGLIDVHVVAKVVGSVGLAPALLGMPGAVQRARRGDSVGWYFLTAWLGYFICTFVMVSTIRGQLPANFWTLHSFQFGATLDMLLFLRVLALRLHAVHGQRDRALSLAATDTLTGLPNRRGLQDRLQVALARAGEENLCALYLLDLDGFKPVNDQYGHAVGDQLLVAVAERLRSQVRTHSRHADMVARLGGDEFVVLATGLPAARQAEILGQYLLNAFDQPFAIDGESFRLGATIGYALSPRHGTEAHALLQRADAAMYTGKREGKRRLTSAES